MNVFENIAFLCLVVRSCLGGVYAYDYYNPSYSYYVENPNSDYFASPNYQYTNNDLTANRDTINYQPPFDAYRAFFEATSTLAPATTPHADSTDDTNPSTTTNPLNVTVEELISECTDLYNECPSFAKNNYCVKFRKQMLFQCRKSCDFCDLHPLDNSTDDEADAGDGEEQDPSAPEAQKNDSNEDDQEQSGEESANDEDSSDDGSENSISSDNDDTENNSEKDSTPAASDDDDEPKAEGNDLAEVVGKIKKRSDGKKHKIVLKPRSPVYATVINDDPNQNLLSTLTKNNYDTLKERFTIPGYEPTAEEIYAETGQIAASSINNRVPTRRMLKKSKRSKIPKQTKSTDPYQYLKQMDNTKESMQPIRDTRKNPENSNLFKSSVDSIKEFFYARKKRSDQSSGKTQTLIPNQPKN